ncbi:hypothetical protein HF325_004984 [Metschnikowia pulcherrima]|uniref:Uncharacterized protein n=1 Tax=Metschnikowia pulcherrima TaxID=27326 RepID=A0A8H7GQD3_9ASCO|nr:hypothetical protein HF325_004984 [Metschnikowia pulcherrima]
MAIPKTLITKIQDSNQDKILPPKVHKLGTKKVVLKKKNEDLKDLLQVVRETVPLQDDPTIPVLTFRFFLLSVIFIVPGAFH